MIETKKKKVDEWVWADYGWLSDEWYGMSDTDTQNMG